MVQKENLIKIKTSFFKTSDVRFLSPKTQLCAPISSISSLTSPKNSESPIQSSEKFYVGQKLK